mmetsp:Transcript_4865/g.12121  ORF Transcript_4865/g.12121 Transcript_4865/m.12121 type:complete len:174 (-) Transcript_4865:432-953(-)
MWETSAHDRGIFLCRERIPIVEMAQPSPGFLTRQSVPSDFVRMLAQAERTNRDHANFVRAIARHLVWYLHNIHDTMHDEPHLPSTNPMAAMLTSMSGKSAKRKNKQPPPDSISMVVSAVPPLVFPLIVAHWDTPEEFSGEMPRPADFFRPPPGLGGLGSLMGGLGGLFGGRKK